MLQILLSPIKDILKAPTLGIMRIKECYGNINNSAITLSAALSNLASTGKREPHPVW